MIDLQNISFSYKKSGASVNTPATETSGVLNINLKIKRGELVVLCGESGCGKTTLTRILNGLIPYYYEGELTGEYYLNGRSMKNTKLNNFAAQTGSVFQNPRSQFFNVDTDSELAFSCENRGIPADEILERMGKVIGEFRLQTLMGRSLFALSGGEKQKIACASIAVMEPEICILDEPTSNLDLVTINELNTIIEIWKAAGKTIVIAEHRLYWLKKIADRYIYMEGGKIQDQMSADMFNSMSEAKLHNIGLRTLFPSFGNEINTYEPVSRSDDDSGLIKFNRFRCRFKKKTVLDIEHLELPSNQIIGIIGYNGAGKTTFMKGLCGLEKKVEGKMKFNGRILKRKARRKLCYMVFQDVNHQLFTESVQEEVLLSCEDEDTERAGRILEAMNLSAKKDLHPMALSGGEKQRLAIASALATEKKIIVFDEPTSGLDYRHMTESSQLFRQLKNNGKSVLIITHDYELLINCCDLIISLENGKVSQKEIMPSKNTAGKQPPRLKEL